MSFRLTEPERQVGIVDEARRVIFTYAELLGVDGGVHRGPEYRRIREERVEGACDEDGELLEAAPLQGVVGVLGGDGEEGLAVGGVVAL